MAADLGKYLGVPLHHEKVAKATYQFTVDKVKQRLSNWKCHSLSLAARNTLIQSVASAIPNHVMQTSLIPISCCDDLDKSARDFLWGSTSEKKKTHLIAWDKVCTPKSRGGLGLRHACLQNKALMMKVGWGLVAKKDALWARVIRSKYDCGVDLLPNIRMEAQGSRIWSGIKNTWKEVSNGIEIFQHNGEVNARWKLDRSGQFTVKSAYSLLVDETTQDERWWKDLWKVQVPQRCKLQMWLSLHDRLLTNKALFDRRIHPDGLCGACPSCEESLIHVLRDCSRARVIWYSLGILVTDEEFWECNQFDWLTKNIHLNSRNGVENWNALFCVSCWLIWRRRNEVIHQNVCPSSQEGVAEIQGIVQCMRRARFLLTRPQNFFHLPRGASRNDSSMVLFQVDGAYSQGSSSIGCGGVLRNSENIILEGFMFSGIGDASIAAELWGCYWGLRIAWDAGHRNVRILCDAVQVIEGVYENNTNLHVDASIFEMIRGIMGKEWRVELKYIPRVENSYADLLAKKSFNYGMGLHRLNKHEVEMLMLDASNLM